MRGIIRYRCFSNKLPGKEKITTKDDFEMLKSILK